MTDRPDPPDGDDAASPADAPRAPADAPRAPADAPREPPSAPASDDPPTLSRAALALAWREHRRYVAFAAALFALGVPMGIALYESGFDLFGAMGLGSARELFPEHIDALVIFLNNSRAFFVFMLGALTAGVLTTIGLVFNGLLVGYVMTPAAAQRGYGFVVLALFPHGVFELPALFVAAGVAYRFLGNVVLYALDRRDHFYTRGEVERTLLLVAVAWVVLAVAAVVEIHVTAWLLEQVYGTAG